MKKLLVAFNATTYSSTLAQFAIKMARQSNSSLHAVFINPSFAPVAQYPFPNDLPLASSGLVSTEEMIKESQQLIEADMQVFQNNCAEHGVKCKMNSTTNIGLEDLIDHSAFSDVILCDSKE